MHLAYLTAADVCKMFSDFSKSAPALPLEHAGRQVGEQFAIMPITLHYTLKSWVVLQLCAKLC